MNISPSRFPLKHILQNIFVCSLLLTALNVAADPIPNYDLQSMPLDPAKTGFTITANFANGGRLGASVSKAGDIDNDGYDDFIIGSPTNNNGKGAVYVIYGGPTSSFADINIISPTPLDPATTGFTIRATTSCELGSVVETAGDINNDGYDDIIVGAYKYSNLEGFVSVIYGGPRSSFKNLELSPTSLDPSTTGFSIQGAANGDYFGYSAGSAGDIDNDGYPDIIIGAHERSVDQIWGQGAAYVVYGGPKSSARNLNLRTTPLDPATTGFLITQSWKSTYFGSKVSTAGDINGDKYDDIIIATDQYNMKGAAFVIYGGPRSSFSDIINLTSTPLDPATTGFMMVGDAKSDSFGCSVSSAGDIDNDGYDDIIVGALGNNNHRGIAYVIFGGPKSSLPNLDFSSMTLSSGTTGFTIKGNANNDEFGASVQSAGDLNNDGYSDLIIGAPSKNSLRGAVYVIYGGPKSSLKDIDLASTSLDPVTTGFTITGYGMENGFGNSVSSAGDINNDGFDDIIVGAYLQDVKGAAYVIYSTFVAPQCESPYLSYQSQCILDCPIGTYESSGACQKCPSSCTDCTSATSCQACSSGYVLSNSLCVLPCSAGTYNSSGVCLDCPSFCSSCSSASSCQTCTPGYVISNSLCTLPCSSQPGTFNSSGTCQACPSFCKNCTSESSCQVCNEGYVVSNSLCTLPCSSKPRTFNSSGTCLDCPAFCSTCSSASSCQACEPGYVLNNSLCVLPCSTGTYNSSGVCHDCPSFCSSCTSASSCQTCESGYVLSNSLCALPCSSQPRTFNSSGTCLDCPAFCSTCSSASSCQACDPGYVLNNSLCVEPCPIRTFNSSGICQECPKGCSSCTNQTTCQTCDTGYNLTNNFCVLPSRISYSGSHSDTAVTQEIAIGMRAISSAINIGSAASPLTAIVSKMIKNTRYLNLSVTDELKAAYRTWDTDLISWKVPDAIVELDHAKLSSQLFARYGLHSAFLSNFWATSMTLTLSITIFIAFFAIQKLFERAKYDNWLSFAIQKLKPCAFNFALVQAYSSFDDILFYLILDFKTNPFTTLFTWASFLSAVGFLALGCFLTLFNIWKVRQYQRTKYQRANVEVFREITKKWLLFYSDFNDADLWRQSTLALLVVRSSLSSAITAAFYQYPLMQTTSFVFLDVAIILFLYFKSPFKTLRGRVAQYCFEAIALLVHLCTLLLAMQGTPSKPSNILSTSIIYLNTLLISGIIGYLFIETYKKMSQKEKEVWPKIAKISVNEEDGIESQSIIYTSSSPVIPDTHLILEKADEFSS